jgi:hypothetical protein
MNSETDVDLPLLTQAKLRSERIRLLCMMGLFAVFLLIGLFRIIVPWSAAPSMGWIVFGISCVFLALEAVVLRTVNRCLEKGCALDRRLGAVHGAFECLFPIVAMFVLFNSSKPMTND